MVGPSRVDILSGTVWKGGNMYDDNISLAFGKGDACQLHTSFMGSGTCSYRSEGDQVLMTFKGSTYAYAVQGSIMQGDLMGAAIRLVKQ